MDRKNDKHERIWGAKESREERRLRERMGGKDREIGVGREGWRP